MKNTIILSVLAVSLWGCVKSDNSALDQPSGHLNGANICSDATPANCVATASCRSPNSGVFTGAPGFVICNNGCSLYEETDGTFRSSSCY